MSACSLQKHHRLYESVDSIPFEFCFSLSKELLSSDKLGRGIVLGSFTSILYVYVWHFPVSPTWPWVNRAKVPGVGSRLFCSILRKTRG